MHRVLFRSKDMDWETPRWLFDKLNGRFRFKLDAAASADNRLCEYYLSQNSLSHDWSVVDSVWLNPPCGRELGQWVKKAYETSRTGTTVVMLIPSRTDTAYFHDYITKASELWFLRGRLEFTKGGRVIGKSTFPSIIVVFSDSEDHIVRYIDTKSLSRGDIYV